MSLNWKSIKTLFLPATATGLLPSNLRASLLASTSTSRPAQRPTLLTPSSLTRPKRRLSCRPRSLPSTVSSFILRSSSSLRLPEGMPRSDKLRFMGCEAAAASSKAEGVPMSRPARAAGEAKASKLLDGEAPSRLLDMAERPELLVWLKLLVMAMPPIAGLEAEACCDCAVVEMAPLPAVVGTLRGVGVFVWAGLLSDVCESGCLLRKLAFVVFGVVMAILFLERREDVVSRPSLAPSFACLLPVFNEHESNHRSYCVTLACNAIPRRNHDPLNATTLHHFT